MMMQHLENQMRLKTAPLAHVAWSKTPRGGATVFDVQLTVGTRRVFGAVFLLFLVWIVG
jgi:hypothetical protein